MLYNGEIFTRGVIKGIEKAYRSILPSYGPTSKNVIIDKDGKPYITRDGATIIESLVFDDSLEDIGLKLAQVAAHNTMVRAGDGTSLTVVFVFHLIKELNRLVIAGFNNLELVRELEREINFLIENIKNVALPVRDEDQIYNLIYNSCREKQLAKDMTELFGYVGDTGIITIEEGLLPDNQIRYTDGYSFDAGLIDPVFANSDSTLKCTLDNPYVLIYMDLIRHTKHLLPIVNKVNNIGESLFILISDITDNALEFLKANVHQKNIKVNVVKIPFLGEKGNAYTRDVAAVTGAKIFDPNINPIETIQLEDLGRADKIESNRESTLIYNGHGDWGDHLKRLQEIGKEKDRIARLSGGIGSLFVGGQTEPEMIERKMRAEDALASVRSALQYGYINNVASTLHNLETSDSIIGKVLKKILKQPFQIICENTDKDYHELKNKINKKVYDFEKGIFLTQKQSTLCDSVLVPIEALRNSVSVVKTIIGGNMGIVKK